MFRLVLISIVIVPVLIGMTAGLGSRRLRGILLIALVAYQAGYVAMLFYLRHRWVG